MHYVEDNITIIIFSLSEIQYILCIYNFLFSIDLSIKKIEMCALVLARREYWLPSTATTTIAGAVAVAAVAAQLPAPKSYFVD